MRPKTAGQIWFSALYFCLLFSHVVALYGHIDLVTRGQNVSVHELVIAADDLLCARTERLAVSAVDEAQQDIKIIELAWSKQACRYQLVGLVAGTYRIQLHNEYGVLASRLFSLPNGGRAVSLTTSAALVEARVTFNGIPWSAVELEVTSEHASSHFRTSPTGLVALRLDEEGEYTLRFRDRRSYPKTFSKRVIVPNGYSRIEVAVVGGSLTAAVFGDRLIGSADLVIGGRDSTTRLRLEGGPMIRFDVPLPFGDYRISAISANRASSEVPVTLSDTQPSASVNLALVTTGGIIKVQAQGPLPDGVSLTGAGFRAIKTASDTFSLSGVPHNARLRVRAMGYAATCVVALSMPLNEVFLRRGDAVEIQLPNAARDPSDLEFLDLPGSQCPVPISWFVVEQAGSGRFVVRDFPAIGIVRVIQQGRTSTLVTTRHIEK